MAQVLENIALYIQQKSLKLRHNSVLLWNNSLDNNQHFPFPLLRTIFYWQGRINTADTIVSENICKKNQGKYFVKSIGVISGSSYLFFLPAPLMRDVLHDFLLTTTAADQRIYKEEESKYTSQFTSLQIIYF